MEPKKHEKVVYHIYRVVDGEETGDKSPSAPGCHGYTVCSRVISVSTNCHFPPVTLQPLTNVQRLSSQILISSYIMPSEMEQS